MLTVAKITRSAAVGYAEYLDGKARSSELGDYYLKDGERSEAPGRWVAGATTFCLDPNHPVTGEELHALMDVRRPDTGEELRRVGGSGEAVAALDATFSAPKSVSAAWALAGPDLRVRIERAHETAVDRALTYATRQVPMLRRRVSQDAVVREKAVGVVATSWRHTTARAVADQVPDPQLHSHVLLHAAVRRDGRLVAIDSRSWLVHHREIGSAYRTELARELNELGFKVQRGTGRGGRYFELEGVPQGLLDRWSSRRHQVLAAIRERVTEQERALQAIVAVGGSAASEAEEQLGLLRRSGQLSPKQDRMVAIATRNTKTPMTVEGLDREWRSTALEAGVSPKRVDMLRYQDATPLEPAAATEVLAGLTEFDATFAAREARAVALERSAGAPIQAALDQLRVLRDEREILVLADGTGTTRDHRGREHAVIAITRRLAAARTEPILGSVIAEEVSRLDRELSRVGGRLSDEQREAIELGCGEHPLVVIQGHAGTGKSTALTGIARAHEACRREIIVTSTAALAAQRLAIELMENGVSCHAYSTAGLQAALTSGRVQLTSETTVIHDEAALASTCEQLRLLKAVEESGARLIEVGDPRQNQPVGAGGLWDRIEHATRLAGALAELTVNQRARDPADRQAQAWFRDGQTELAVGSYAARGRVHIHPDQRRVEDQALEAAHADRTGGETTLVLAQTSNEHLDELNARAQAIRRQHGELGDDQLEIPGRPYGLHTGDLVQVRRTIPHEDLGQLRNGTTVAITAIDPKERQLDVRLGGGTQLSLHDPEIAQADLRLAYVQHPFPAQGHTTDTAHLIIAAHATREGSYVALTRARQQTHIYAPESPDPSPDSDRLKDLAEQISRTEREIPSIQTPLSHEDKIRADNELSRTDTSLHRPEPVIGEAAVEQAPEEVSPQAAQPPGEAFSLAQDLPEEPDRVNDEPDLENAVAAEPDLELRQDRNANPEKATARAWPKRPAEQQLTAKHLADRDRTPGWDL